MKIDGKCVFITGGAGGIGHAFARSLLQKGAKICLADLDQAKGKEVLEDLTKEFGTGKVFFEACNVTKADSFKNAFQNAVATLNHIDVMINSAGLSDYSRWSTMLAVNLNGTIIGTELALKHMRKDEGGKGGVVINVASIMGIVPLYFAPVYTASKHGVVGYTRAMATGPDVIQLGVRYACICPEAVDTPFIDTKPGSIIDRYYDDVKKFLDCEKLKPEAVAEGLVTLLEDDNSNEALLVVSLKEGLVRKTINIVSVQAQQS